MTTDTSEFERLLADAIKRLDDAKTYGVDMQSSKELCVNDAIELLRAALLHAKIERGEL